MKRIFALTFVFMLFACQSQNAAIDVIILDGDTLISLQSDSNTPSAFLAQAGVDLSEADKIQFHGADLPTDFSLPRGSSYTLQIRRAHMITINTPDGTQTIQTTADNVGLALAQAGLQLFAADYVSPSLDTQINSDLTVTYRSAQDLKFSSGGKTIVLKSSQQTIGQALAATGFSLSGLDKSLPGDSQPLPLDGQIKIIRVSETVTLQEKTIPFSQAYEYSVDLPVGEQKVLQAGELGLTVSRIRIRNEDGLEVARIIETETVVRHPQESIISLGTQVQIQTLDTPDGQIQYWRAVQMYTTSYSPCGLGTGKCSYGTASGLPAQYGVVALTPSLFNQLAFSKVYVPGYGVGVIGDVGGGFPDHRLWIDLGYNDDNYQPWSGYHTVYFLAPAPLSIPAGLN